MIFGSIRMLDYLKQWYLIGREFPTGEEWNIGVKKYNLQIINFNCSWEYFLEIRPVQFLVFSHTCTFFLKCSLSVTAPNITELAASKQSQISH